MQARFRVSLQGRQAAKPLKTSHGLTQLIVRTRRVIRHCLVRHDFQGDILGVNDVSSPPARVRIPSLADLNILQTQHSVDARFLGNRFFHSELILRLPPRILRRLQRRRTRNINVPEVLFR